MSMHIFYTGSVRGGRERHIRIIDALKKYGTVTYPSAYFDTLSGHGETELPRHTIAERERDALAKSDIVVAEISTPSLGVGYLVAYATSLGKKVVALYQGEDTFKLSAMIKGDTKIGVHTYRTEEDIEKILTETLTPQK